MRPLIYLSRITVLTACAMWLLTRTPIVHAQLQNCSKFNTENGAIVCPSCCSSSPSVMSWTDGTSEGAGTQVLTTMYASCGSATGSCPSGTQYTGCGSEPWLQAVDDPAECCLLSGTPCNQGTCCTDLICLSSNICGACRTTGQTCGATSDCCSGECNGGTCASSGGGAGGGKGCTGPCCVSTAGPKAACNSPIVIDPTVKAFT